MTVKKHLALQERAFLFPAVAGGGAATAAEGPRSPQKAGVLRADCSSPENPQGRVAAPRSGPAEGLCAPPGGASAGQRAERQEETQPEKTQEEMEAESRGPMGEQAAGAGLNGERETEEVAQGERAAQAAPAEERGDVPLAKLEGSPPGSTVRHLGGPSSDVAKSV